MTESATATAPHPGLALFPPTRGAALQRLAAVDAAAYAQTRNHLNGAVTRLSPYLTHGLLTLPEAFDAVHARTPLHAEHRLVLELGWRAYHRHVWAQLPSIHQSLHPGPLPDAAYHPQMPADVCHARTGVPVVDRAVQTLLQTGYLHNHARLWLASYLVHVRKVHWHAGATWMLGHLLDGDLASNHLSWQWVAGTASHKPYLFNADNVARFAPSEWHSPGTAIDTGYDQLLQVAHTPPVAAPRAGDAPALRPEPFDAPAATDHPPAETGWLACNAPALARAPLGGNAVWLMHPWALAGPPDDLAPSRPAAAAHHPPAVVAVGSAVCHAQTPWRPVRWQFVTQGLRAHTPWCLWDTPQALARALAGFRTVHWPQNPHAAPLWAALQAAWAHHPQPPQTVVHPEPLLFAPVDGPVASFSAWWRRTRLLRAVAPAPAPTRHWHR